MSPPHFDAREGRGPLAPSLGVDAVDPVPVYAVERGQRFLWPALGAAYYQDPGAAAMRLALKAWPYGTGDLDPPPSRGTDAVLYLAADVTYLRTLTGAEPPLAAPAAYERALRAAPAFADAPRALVMLGVSQLRVGLGPEAETTFARMLQTHADSPFAPLAAIGRVSALRMQRRLDDARHALAAAPARLALAVTCERLEEEGGLARARGDHARAVAVDAQLLAQCASTASIVRTLADRVESLVAVGRRAEARQILLEGARGRTADDAAMLYVRTATLAREDGEPEVAYDVLDRARSRRTMLGMSSVIEAHRAFLDAATAPERAFMTFERLYAEAPTNAARTAVLRVWIDALVEHRRFEDALDVVTSAEPFASGAVAGELRRLVLARWIDRLSIDGGATEVVALYARYRTLLDTQAGAATVCEVARALEATGLTDAALRLLSLHASAGDPEVSLAAAELAYARGRLDLVHREIARLADHVLSPAQAVRRDGLERQLGCLSAPTVAPPTATPAATAAVAIDRVGGGLPSDDEVARLVAALGSFDEPLVRRGASLLAATRSFGPREALRAR